MALPIQNKPNDGSPEEINKFIDWAYGRETDATHGAVARFVQTHARTRPAVGCDQEPRWESFDALRTHIGWAGPTVTLTQLNAAIAAFRA